MENKTKVKAGTKVPLADGASTPRRNDAHEKANKGETEKWKGRTLLRSLL